MSLSMSQEKAKQLFDLTIKFEEIIHAFNSEMSDLLKERQTSETSKQNGMKKLAEKVGYKVNNASPEYIVQEEPYKEMIPEKNAEVTTNANLINGLVHKKSGKKVVKPCTPFFLFMRDKRKDITKAFPALPPIQITKLFGNIWKEFTSDEKKPYIDSYNETHAKYKDFIEKKQNTLMI